jgi:hypothetical protein
MGTFMVLRELRFILINLDKNLNCSIMRAESLPCRRVHNICCAVYGIYVEVLLGLNDFIRNVHFFWFDTAENQKNHTTYPYNKNQQYALFSFNLFQ